MCQLVVCTFLLSLTVCLGYVKETSRNSNADVYVKNPLSTSIKPVNILKHFPGELTTRTFYTFNNITHKTQKFSKSTRSSPTLKRQTSKSSVFSANNLKLRKPSRKTLKSLTVRTQALNSPPPNAQTVNFATLNPYIPEDTQSSPKTNNKKTINEIHDEKLEEWLENTNVNYSLPYDDKDTRRTHIEGLHEFKSRMKEESNKAKKRSEKFIDDDIILNNKYELNQLLIHDPVLPNFNESFVDLATEKLNEIQSKYLKLKVDEEALKSGRRDLSNDSDSHVRRAITKKPNPIDRILALMHQFLYLSQKRLINGQLLRKKYVIYVKYKLGYTFSLLRILKQQQLRLYSSMHFYRFYTPKVWGTWYTPVADADYYLTMYERINRLDDDIITLVRFMWQLNEERKVQAEIDATRFPKRMKSTPGDHLTVYVPRPPPPG